VADLLGALERSDLVVIVQVMLMDGALGGDTRLLAATDSCRYLLLRVHSARSPEAQIESLGHELQHALEVAGAPDVRDQAGFVRLLERIGRKTGRGTFETDAAVRVSRRIHDEIAASDRKLLIANH
jgi:hypothetical protein